MNDSPLIVNSKERIEQRLVKYIANNNTDAVAAILFVYHERRLAKLAVKADGPLAIYVRKSPTAFTQEWFNTVREKYLAKIGTHVSIINKNL